jgi:hypothetical protein
MGHVELGETPTWPEQARSPRGHCHFGFFGFFDPLPPDFAIASDDRLVDRSIVTAGGVITAKRPHLARKTRRSVIVADVFSRGRSAMAVVPPFAEPQNTQSTLPEE